MAPQELREPLFALLLASDAYRKLGQMNVTLRAFALVSFEVPGLDQAGPVGHVGIEGHSHSAQLKGN